MDLVGVAAGHVYFYLEDVYPNPPGRTRPKLLRTPRFLYVVGWRWLLWFVSVLSRLLPLLCVTCLSPSCLFSPPPPMSSYPRTRHREVFFARLQGRNVQEDAAAAQDDADMAAAIAAADAADAAEADAAAGAGRGAQDQ